MGRPKKTEAKATTKPTVKKAAKAAKKPAAKKEKKDSFLDDLIKATESDYASVAIDGIHAGDFQGFIDTGSYALNALFSGSIYGGVAKSKITGFAGASSTGKTFFALALIKNFLDQNADGYVAIFESESAYTKQMLAERGLDLKRIGIFPVETVEQYKTQAIRLINSYIEMGESRPLLFVLDSLGNLSTEKEIADTESGSTKRDMTRTQLIKGAFRVLTLKLGKTNITHLVTNHTYQTQDLFSRQVSSGGSGLQYAASAIGMLSKAKEKRGDEVIGNIIKIKLDKSRLTRENSSVRVLLTYDKGLDRYFGLQDIAVAAGIFKQISKRFKLPGMGKDESVDERVMMENPEKYFTEDILNQIDEACKGIFLYGSSMNSPKTMNVDDTAEYEDM